MAKMTFTARWVESVNLPEKGQVDYFDTKPPGVGLRISYSGRKSWFVMYRSGGRLRRLTLGTYPALTLADARDKATAAKHSVAQGEDPALQKQSARIAPTVAELAEQYLAKHAKPNKKSWKEDERLLNRDVVPFWGRRKAFDIKRRDVIELLDGIVERGAPVQANRVLALVRKMFNWAISRDLLEHNPCMQVKDPGREQQRDRVLHDEEIRLVWDACVHLTPLMGAYIKMLILTAQRVSEMRRMHWDEIDMASGWWTIPAEIAKNGLAHRVPLSTPAQSVLQALQEETGSTSWVFPSPRRRNKHVVNVQDSAAQLRRCTGVDFILHDLRRTVASHLTSLGFPRLTVAKILNHAEAGVTRVYDRHSYDAEKREALETWGRKIMELINRETR